MEQGNTNNQKSNWSAVWAMTIGVSGLIIAEFLPAGVLTPMARDLAISEGTAGQAVTATSVFAVITSLLIAYITRKLNRRTVLLSLSALLAVSSLVVAMSPNFSVLLIGRVILGISLGGFWSMAAAIAIRLVKEADVPRALSLIFGGSAFSSVLAAPLGSYLGSFIGWRQVFLFAAVVGVLGFVWLYFAMPSLKPHGTTKLRTTLDVLKVPQFSMAMLAIMFVFCGRFASFTYLRPFLEKTTHLNVNWVSTVMLVFGLAYFVGNTFAARMIKNNLRKTLMTPAIALAIISLGLIAFGSSLAATIMLIFLMGAVFGPLAPGWSTWVAKKVPEHAETGGGLYVAAIQFSAAIGAFVGGMVFDVSGSAGVFVMCGASFVISALLVYWKISNLKATLDSNAAHA